LEVARIPLTKMPRATFVTYLNDTALTTLSNVTDDVLEEIFDQNLSVEDVFEANNT